MAEEAELCTEMTAEDGERDRGKERTKTPVSGGEVKGSWKC